MSTVGSAGRLRCGFLCNVTASENIHEVERRWHDHYVLGRLARRGRGKNSRIFRATAK
jgi:hypothetical protein